MDRRLELIRSRLDGANGVAHVQGGTVNEVLLATVAAGLRELLHARWECVEDLALRAAVPVLLHHEEPGQARGDLDGVMIVAPPISEADVIPRLQSIAKEIAWRKTKAVRPVTCCLAIASSSGRSSGAAPGSD